MIHFFRGGGGGGVSLGPISYPFIDQLSIEMIPFHINRLVGSRYFKRDVYIPKMAVLPILQVVKSLPFYIRQVCKTDPLRAEAPCIAR